MGRVRSAINEAWASWRALSKLWVKDAVGRDKWYYKFQWDYYRTRAWRRYGLEPDREDNNSAKARWWLTYDLANLKLAKLRGAESMYKYILSVIKSRGHKRSFVHYITYMGFSDKDPEGYFQCFLGDCEARGIKVRDDVNRIPRFRRKVELRNLSGTTAGLARYTCANNRVGIEIDEDTWNSYGRWGRAWILYHEAGHDVLNLDHVGGSARLMSTSINAFSILTEKEFMRVTRNLFEDYANKEESSDVKLWSTCTEFVGVK